MTEADTQYEGGPRENKRAARQLFVEHRIQKKTRQRGKLGMLLDMPLDVLFEIFGHLHPVDVLHLARTSKSLRDVLMTRSATVVWKQARAQLDGLPDCPQDLNESQYASLLFDTYCHFCLAPRAMDAMWICRTRCCKKCFAVHFIAKDSLEHIKLNPDLALSIPWTAVKATSYTLRAKFDEFYERYARLCASGEQAEADMLVKERAKEVEILRQTSQELSNWRQRQARLRTLNKEQIRLKRRDAIIHELRELGYGEELDKLSERRRMMFLNHPMVKQPKELSPRIWDNIRGDMVALMVKIKQNRLHAERFDQLTKHCKTITAWIQSWVSRQSRAEFLPCPADYCAMVVIQTIVDTWDHRPPNANEIIDNLPALAEVWRRKISSQLLPLIPGVDAVVGWDVEKMDISPLELAITWFFCKSCKRSVGYPRILVHRCTREPLLTDFSEQTQELTLQSAMEHLLEQDSWHIPSSGLIYDEYLSAHARAIIEACGKDPATATAMEMDRLNARIICGDSKCVGRAAIVMSWRVAIFEHLHDGVQWTLVGKQDRVTIDRIEDERKDARVDFEHIWACLRCNKLHPPRNRIALVAHMRKVHNMSNTTVPQEGRDYAFHQDTPVPYPGPKTSCTVRVDELSSQLRHKLNIQNESI